MSLNESELVELAKSYICENIKDLHYPGKIAPVLGVKYFTLRNAFKWQTGETLKHYFDRQKMEYAKKLLREETWDIISIAHEVGYKNERLFYRIFKRIVGMTPCAYRHTNADTEQKCQ